jgi:hypothetical protein
MSGVRTQGWSEFVLGIGLLGLDWGNDRVSLTESSIHVHSLGLESTSQFRYDIGIEAWRQASCSQVADPQFRM